MICRTILTIFSTIVLFFTSAANVAPASGLLLGIYAYPNWQGLRVLNTIPGYSADGQLWRGDTLLRMTDGMNMHSVKNIWQIERAKNRIGPHQQAALEIFCPGFDKLYYWVEFVPIGGVAVHSKQATRGKVQTKVRIMTEHEKPGPAALFQKRKTGQGSVSVPVPLGSFS